MRTVFCEFCNTEYPNSQFNISGCSCKKAVKKRTDEARHKATWDGIRKRANEKKLLKHIENIPVKKQIPRESLKGAEKRAKLDKIKRKLKDKADDMGMIKCKGCSLDKPRAAIQASHSSSVGSRVDLAEDEDNMFLLCDPCHKIWENGHIREKINLHCFYGKMIYLYEKDKSKFYKFYDSLTDYCTYNNSEKAIKQINLIDEYTGG